MIGKLDVEEDVMDENIASKRKSTAVMKTVHQKLADTIATLGWDCYDNVVVEIGGTSVSGIDVGEEYNKKWQSPIGTRKYNKDAFIVIKNLDRCDNTKSEPMEEFKPRHGQAQTKD
mgnify:FL=1|jgi:hypothetical protein|tara:strand:- start:85 stop:432 length:348 start_codon:yes stop_codon:yes gene_type:complete